MAVEKGKVLARIELILKGKSLSKNFKDDIAAKWAEKIEDDDAIEDYINDREDVLIAASSEADRVRTTTVKKEEPKVETETKKEQDDMPAWAKSLFDEFKGFKAEKQKESLSDKFKKDERFKGMPDFMFKGRIPSTEEEYEPFAEELAADFKGLAEKTKLEGYGGDAPASGDKKEHGKVKPISKEEAKAIVKSMS